VKAVPSAQGARAVKRAAVITVESLEYRRLLSTAFPGQLDPSFGNNGATTTDLTAGPDAAQAIVLQADGKIVTAGAANGDSFIARYTAAGQLDPTFGPNSTGTFIKDFGGADQFTSLVLQSDGKLLAAGFVNGDFLVARFTIAGQLDSGFGQGGWTKVDFQGRADDAQGLAITADGRIVLGGSSVASGSGDLALAILSNNGQQVLMSQRIDLGHDERALDLNLTSDERVLLSGFQSNPGAPRPQDALLARVRLDGALDTTFAGTGFRTLDASVDPNFNGVESQWNSVTSNFAGEIVAVGEFHTFNGGIGLIGVEYGADGKTVRFDRAGITRKDGSFANSRLNKVRFLSSGLALAVGAADISVATHYSAISVNWFLQGGFSNVQYFPPIWSANDLVEQPDKSPYSFPKGYVMAGANGGVVSLARVPGQSGRIIGYVYNDKDADGKLDSDEPGRGDGYVFLDLDGNGLLNGNEPSVVLTNDNTSVGRPGSFIFDHLTSGTYRLTYVPAAGWRATSLAGNVTVLELGPGQSTWVTIAATRRSVITGVVFDDVNANGVRDAGETPIVGRVVFRDDDNDGVKDSTEPSSISDDDGRYSILTGVGGFRVREILPAGWTRTVPSAGYYNVNFTSDGSIAAGRDFGSRQAGAVATFATATLLADGTLRVNGTNAADTIKLTRTSSTSLSVKINALAAQTFNAADVHAIRVYAFGGNDSVVLGATGTSAAYIDGGAGNDTIAGGELNDTIVGGDGNDRMFGNGGADVFFGGAGTDIVAYDIRTNSVNLSIDDVANDGEAGENDNIHSTVEQIRGGKGNDTLTGSDGINTLYGGAGNDKLFGMGGDDALFGEADNDVLDGGTGSDFISGGSGSQDEVTYASRTEDISVTLDGVANDANEFQQTLVVDNVKPDIEIVTGGSGNDLLVSGNQASTLRGGGGKDTLIGGGGADRLEGGAGNDTLRARDGIADVLDGGADSDSAQVDQNLDVILNNSVETFLA
jgi:uncharacterized delta-60 repeat protein